MSTEPSWMRGLLRKTARRLGAGAVKDAVSFAVRRMTLPWKIRARSPLWVHFGSGRVADRRFLNVDARIFRHVDYVTKSPAMPAIPNGSADLIYACHVFEHIPFGKQGGVLARWHEILKPNGRLMLSVPDFEKVTGAYHRGEQKLEWVQPIIMGAQDYSDNFHFAMFTEAHLRGLLEEAGFTEVQTWHPANQQNWPKDWSWEESVSLNLSAIKP